jgi:hypothetical protein
MAQADLVALAEKFVRLSAEIEDVRRAMAAALGNGADSHPPPPFERPARPGARPGPKPGAAHPAKARAAKAEAQIVALLQEKPGCRTAQVAEATASKSSATIDRLRRLRDRGLVSGGGAEGWTATSGP